MAYAYTFESRDMTDTNISPPGTSANLHLPIPGAQANSKRLPDIQAVRKALIAIDSSLADLLGFSEDVSLTVIENAINAKIDTLKDDVTYFMVECGSTPLLIPKV